jgi:Tol biopolymer transport system component
MRSELAIYDVATGAVRSVLQTDKLIEAPNWTQDGKTLVINGEGRLFRVPLDGPAAMHPIDTGFAVKCNNDHGLSPDGRTIVISDGSEHGKSCIYLVPIEGGAPRKVTPLTPSYWHGWSPDGALLAYCAQREGVFDIYVCKLDGSAETRLTDGKGHADGPDYTPDGRWIWFNSSRSGSAQLWRMHADGSRLEQMTRDERVNWFPHPSPDGKQVLYLAYETGIDGHPRDKNCELRMIPSEGGTPRVLTKLFGGQGTINVPCWAPDAKQFAFVRYAPAA